MAYINFQPSDHFNTLLYSGTGSTQSITGVGFQPDWVWIKNASSGSNYDHVLYDAVRGVTKHIHSNTTDAEDTQSDGLTAFGTDGFTVGADSKSNSNGSTLVSWNWKAGNSAGSSNTDGSITSTVSANTTAGFSIVTYTGTGISSGTATVGHGLGEVPSVVIQKRTGGTANWNMYHKSIGNTGSLSLNLTSATNSQTDYWGDTTPSSSVVTIGPNTAISGANVLYCFAEKKGYSKFGSYIGNGNANGVFVYTGFKPAFVIAKRTDTANSWNMLDNKRDPFNDSTESNLFADSSNAENTTYKEIEFVSNGMKVRSSGTGTNASGGTYIYMAFAENPFVTSTGIPTTAR